MTNFLKYIYIFLLLAIVAVSCTASKIPTASIKQIDTILFFSPVTTVATIYNGNEGFYDSALSQVSKENLKTGIKEYFPKRIKIVELDIDSSLQKKVDAEIFLFFRQFETRKRKDAITLPKLLDSILLESKINYALCLFQNGYIRTEKNYDKQLLKALGFQTAMTLFSFGVLMYTGSTVFLINNSFNKADSFFSGCILDNKRKNIAFYGRSPVRGENPTNKKFTDSQIRTTFNDYVYKEEMYYKYGR